MCVANEIIMLTTSLVGRLSTLSYRAVTCFYITLSPSVIKSPHLDDSLQAGKSNALRSIIKADSTARLALFRCDAPFRAHLVALTFLHFFCVLYRATTI